MVGSDPYLAPEVYEERRYDPQPADIWSLAIIFACMSLRRFPWKAPRITDNSYKLFISPPTPGTPLAEGLLGRSEQRPKSMMDLPSASEEAVHQRQGAYSEPVSHQTSGDTSGRHHHSHHHDRKQTETSTPGQTTTPEPRSDTPAPKQEVIRGPWRLLRLLPRESRSIIGRMLEVNPRKRATVNEMLEDPWVINTPICTQIEGGQVIKAEGHTHTLEPGTPSTPAPSKK